MNEEDYPYLQNPLPCNDCGHCVAICPNDAVMNTRMDPTDFPKMVDPQINFDQYLNLVRNRRSIRKFKKEPLKQEHLDKILTAVRYIPTGSNKQGLKYLIITDPETLRQIKEAMAKKFALVQKLATRAPGKWFVRKEDQASLTRLVELWKAGEDPYLRDAPCFLIIYAEELYFEVTAWDAGIASYNIDLAAQTLGVGTLQNGFFVTNVKLFKGLKKFTKLPKKATILGSICLGYPTLKYKKAVSRNPLDVKRL
jgi:nitroreductase